MTLTTLCVTANGLQLTHSVRVVACRRRPAAQGLDVRSACVSIDVRRLRLAISEQNLELLPEYEQRIAVLQDLAFIDANSTVLLKGRVACEVRLHLAA